MRGRTVILAVVLVLLLAGGGGMLLDRAGARAPEPTAGGRAPSGVWFCPHGGGSSGWQVALSLTNPGTSSVRARVTTFGGGQSTTPKLVTVPARSRAQVAVTADGRDRASMVEYFGGWIAAGWVARAGGDESGIAAEPCLPRAGRSWLLPDGTTEKGQDAYVVVVNPFATEAVFTLTLVSERRTVQQKGWTNFVLGPRLSTAFHLNQHALGEQTVAAEIDVSIGRVAASSLGIDARGGIRSAIGVPAAANQVILPGVADAGPSDLSLIDPGGTAAHYGVTVLGTSGPSPAKDLVAQQLPPRSVRTDHVTAGAEAVVIRASNGVAAARRSFGLQGDQGATSGAMRPARAWVVSTAAASGGNEVRLYLANPGRQAATVQIYALSLGAVPTEPETVDVPPGTTVPVDRNPGPALSSVVAISRKGTFVPAEASYTARGIGFATATGVPIPARWVPRD
jgi:uncharacterized protein DUF5719